MCGSRPRCTDIGSVSLPSGDNLGKYLDHSKRLTFTGDLVFNSNG